MVPMLSTILAGGPASFFLYWYVDNQLSWVINYGVPQKDELCWFAFLVVFELPLMFLPDQTFQLSTKKH